LSFSVKNNLRTTISIFIGHYRHRRNHQDIEKKLIEPPDLLPKVGQIRKGGQAQISLRSGFNG